MIDLCYRPRPPITIPYAIDRYVKETNRLYGVLDCRLENRAFTVGDDYSIADMASYPWIVPWKRQQQNLDDFPNLPCWFDMVRGRPGTQRAHAGRRAVLQTPRRHRGRQEDPVRTGRQQSVGRPTARKRKSSDVPFADWRVR